MIDWQEVAVDGETHLERVIEMYEELGFEVCLEEVAPEDAGQCIACYEAGNEKIYRVYVRRKPEIEE